MDRLLSLSSIGRLTALITLLCATSAARANVANDLVRNNPFVPQGWSEPQRQQPPRPPAPTQPQPLDRLEFRSIAKFNGTETFSLFDPTQNRSFWLALNQSDSGFSVVDYNAREDSVVVRHEGRTRTISLHEAKIQAMPVEAPTPPQARPAGGRPAQAGTPEERMQDLAEEIRRRREIRRQLVEGQPEPAPAAQGAGIPDGDLPPLPPQ